MNKRLIISSVALISIGTVSCIVPAEYDFTGNYACAKEKDSVYLSSLSISKSNIDFDQDVYYYKAVIDKDANEIKVRAKPKDEDSSVSINGNYVDEGDNYKKTIELDDGYNLIKIKVTNGDEETKTYTINVVKGEGDKDEVYLDNLKLNNQSISLLKEETEYTASVNEYTESAIITAVPEDDNYEVSIDGANCDKESNFQQKIDLAVGENPIIIKIKKKKSKDEREYILTIKRESSFDNKEVQDDIYLDYIKIDDNKINLNKNDSIYNINVKENMEKVYITAEPENIDYKIKINDKIVEESDDFRDFFTLKKGKNVISILVRDLENKKQRMYTLNIMRGEFIETTNNSIGIDNNTKINQWIKSEDGWSYIDSTGNKIKNSWFSDKSTGNEYYLKDDGIMAIGWQMVNNKWYYLNYSGEKQFGWQYLNKQWYYLDNKGEMQTGWLRDINGKWYYLYDNGSMASNTIVNGYVINVDGSWTN